MGLKHFGLDNMSLTNFYKIKKIKNKDKIYIKIVDPQK